MVLPVVLYGFQTWALKFRERVGSMKEYGAREGA